MTTNPNNLLEDDAETVERVQTKNPNAYAVMHRIFDFDRDMSTPDLFITNVPRHVTKSEVKDNLDKAQRVFGEIAAGTSVKRPWQNYTVQGVDEWDFYTCYDLENDLKPQITYDDLQLEAKGERKVTLRLPVAVCLDLEELADEVAQDLNAYCVDVLSRHSKLGRDSTELSHRDAMRALYQIYGGDRESVVQGWVKLFELNLVRIKKNSSGNPPMVYSQLLFQDGISKKKWLVNPVSDTTMEIVKDALKVKN
ncbi:MAG TPA: hypothetical protein VGK19_07120 [Capsulimonadaceae bacterium]|jgi:hypothetical protein